MLYELFSLTGIAINIAVGTDIARSRRLAVAVGKEWMWSDGDQRRTGLADGPRSKRGSGYSPFMVRRRFSWLGLSVVRQLISGGSEIR